MFRSLRFKWGLTETAVALAALVTISLVGCSNELATAPEATLVPAEDGTGEVPLPIHRRPGVPTPAGFQVVNVGYNTATVCWNSPGSAYTAVIYRDGEPLTCCCGTSCQFVDETLSGGAHTYSMFYTYDGKAGEVVQVTVDVPIKPDDDGRSRTDKRPESAM